jgi:hypothetical protein
MATTFVNTRCFKCKLPIVQGRDRCVVVKVISNDEGVLINHCAACEPILGVPSIFKCIFCYKEMSVEKMGGIGKVLESASVVKFTNLNMDVVSINCSKECSHKYMRLMMLEMQLEGLDAVPETHVK